MTSERQYNAPFTAWPVGFGNQVKGSRALPVTADFTISSPAVFNLQNEELRLIINEVQGIYVDNSSNSYPIICTIRGTNQKITWAAGAQGYMPVLVGDNAHFSFATTGTPKIPVFFLNFPVPVGAWPSGPQSISPAGSVGTDYSVNKPALGTLLATIPANAARLQFEVENQSANQTQVVIDDGAGVNLSIYLLDAGTGAGAQGGSYVNTVDRGRVRIYGGGAADQVFIREN